jgi:peptidoglycan L-alanyl-D-glutamate endopeptidase CwlK
MDTVSEQRLSEVYPGLATLVRQMATQLEAEGIDIRVTQSLRTIAEQEALYAEGRTAPGSIVTEARAGYSWHNFGLAVDVVPLTPQGPDWNISHPVWARIVAIGVDSGLVAGAEWRTFPDWPHFQLTGRFPTSPNDEARALLASGGLDAVWKAAFGSAPQATQLNMEGDAD